MPTATSPAGSGLKVTRAPTTLDLPQLRPTTKGKLDPKTPGRAVIADIALGVNLLVDHDNVAETSILGVKVFQHKEKSEQYWLAELYALGGPVGGSVGYLGSLGLFKVEFPAGGYEKKYDQEIAEKVRDLAFPGPKAYPVKK